MPVSTLASLPVLIAPFKISICPWLANLYSVSNVILSKISFPTFLSELSFFLFWECNFSCFASALAIFESIKIKKISNRLHF